MMCDVCQLSELTMKLTLLVWYVAYSARPQKALLCGVLRGRFALSRHFFVCPRSSVTDESCCFTLIFEGVGEIDFHTYRQRDLRSLPYSFWNSPTLSVLLSTQIGCCKWLVLGSWLAWLIERFIAACDESAPKMKRPEEK
jgi:hypothetical protein